MNITFEQGAFDDFTGWAAEDKKLYKRLVSLIKETAVIHTQAWVKPKP
jgi:Txe/YoeB family toxin of Txe-Axe toxin-antitoxin module